MADDLHILATNRTWSLSAFQRYRAYLPGRWAIAASTKDLLALEYDLSPRRIFFTHWSEIVPKQIHDRRECIVFHMTDVPYGRGGSPLQNLIARGHRETHLTALRMEEELDAGPVYLKRPLTLDGAAEEIFARASDLAMDMIREIIETDPVPEPQSGEPVVFRRRTPAMSALPPDGTLDTLYDHIRMLDASGYPRAFIEHGVWRMEFRNVARTTDGLDAHVRISVRSAEEPKS
jgi:methionyl-tRNA formyltransferase